MGCIKRENTGSCNHFQCPFQELTEHGYGCVDIITHKGESFCEVGFNCLSKCHYSFVGGDDKYKVSEDWIKEIEAKHQSIEHNLPDDECNTR